MCLKTKRFPFFRLFFTSFFHFTSSIKFLFISPLPPSPLSISYPLPYPSFSPSASLPIFSFPFLPLPFSFPLFFQTLKHSSSPLSPIPFPILHSPLQPPSLFFPSHFSLSLFLSPSSSRPSNIPLPLGYLK